MPDNKFNQTGAEEGRASKKIYRIEGGQPRPAFTGKQAKQFPTEGTGIMQQPDGSYRVVDRNVYNSGGKDKLEKMHKSFYPTRSADVYDDDDPAPQSKPSGFRYIPEMMPDFKKEQVETFNPRFRVVCANGVCTAADRGNTMEVKDVGKTLSPSQFQANNNAGRVANKLGYDLDGQGGAKWTNDEGHKGIRLLPKDPNDEPMLNANAVSNVGTDARSSGVKGTGGTQENSLFRKILQNLNSVAAGEGLEDQLGQDYEQGNISKQGVMNLLQQKMAAKDIPQDVFTMRERPVPTGTFSPASGVGSFSSNPNDTPQKQNVVRQQLEKLSLEELVGNASKKKPSNIQIR